MAVKLHRCSGMWVKLQGHPCWRVQKALDDAGVDYEVVKHPTFPRSKRTEYIKLTGQSLFPAIELGDGTIIRRESKELAEMVRSGRLEQSAPAADAESASRPDPESASRPDPESASRPDPQRASRPDPESASRADTESASAGDQGG